jgi:hypothetical protein
VHARAFDRAGKSTTGKANAFKIDNTAPFVVQITNPGSGTVLSNLSQVNGNASDNSGGSGIERVELSLRRSVNGAWQHWGYNASTNLWEWSSTTRFLPTALAAPGALTTNWSCNSNLPSGANLPNGTYYLYAKAFDRVGKYLSSGNVSVRVVATSVQATSVLSAVRLSSATASTSESVLRLTFTGALDVASATEVANFSVQVNGVAVEVESLRYARNTVLIGLTGSTFRAGDKVSVRWDNLRDSNGRLLAAPEVRVTAR